MKLSKKIMKRYFIDKNTFNYYLKSECVLVNDNVVKKDIEINDEDKVYLQDVDLFSVSRIKKYMTCPYSEKLTYRDKLVSEHTFIGTILGTVFHKCVELGIQPLDIEAIHEQFKIVLDKLKEDGIKINLPMKGAKNKKLSDKEWEVKLIEDSMSTVTDFLKEYYKYEIEGQHEVEVNFEIGDYPFIGFIDLLTDEFIVDFKTTYSFNYFNPQSYKLQMALYCYATGLRDAMLFVFARKDKQVLKIFKMHFTEEDINEYVELAKKIAFAIDNEIYWKKDAKWIWDWKKGRMAISDNWCDNVCQFKYHCFGEPPEKK